MNYPEAFIFINANTQLPSLQVIQRWFGKKSPTDIYVQRLSPVDEHIENKITLMTQLHRFIEAPNDTYTRCIVVSGRELGLFAQEGLSENWQGVTWIDSESHLKSLLKLEMCLETFYEFDNYFKELHLCYDAIGNYILYQTGQEPESEPELEEIFRGRQIGHVTKAELALKKVAIEETRANALHRKDLESRAGRQQVV